MAMADNTLKNECIIVTGAAGNLGSAVARLLARKGAQLVCVDRTEGHLNAVTEGLDPDRIMMVGGCDLADAASVERMVAQVIARFGRLTGLVNTVGGFATAKVTEGALEQWDMMMLLNAKIPLITSAAVLPQMVAAGYGRIVHIAAQPGIKATAGQAAYAASKAAVIRLVETIAAEHRSHKITANCVLPGTIDTPVNRASMPNAKPDIWIPPLAIAELIAFLVSPAGAVVTGGAIPATALI